MVYLEESAGDSRTRTGRNGIEELERLGDQIAELAAHVHAATYRLLVMLHEFDARNGWYGGFRSCAHWLSWRTGIGLGAAREKLRVARALHELPRLSEAMRRGELSFAKIRACTRVASRDNEDKLLDLAKAGTASHLERIVRGWRKVDRLEEQGQERERHHRRELTLYIDDDGMYVLRGRLGPEVGAVLERALAAASEALLGRRSASEGSDGQPAADGIERATSAQRRADAIGLVAECALRSALAPAPPEHTVADDSDGLIGETEQAAQSDHAGPNLRHAPCDYAAPRTHNATAGRADRFQVVLHVDAEALREGSESGQSVLEGQHVSAETARRITCDASRIIMVHDANGNTLSVGRKNRTVPPAIRRALEHRDRGCRFPGCGLRYCDAHHIRHWADGGETSVRNTTLLCRRHHRAVHEEGYCIAIAPDGELMFQRPDGRPVPVAPLPPRIPDDPVANLTEANTALGLPIDASTPLSDWRGERLDLGYAVLILRRACAAPLI